MVSATRYLKDEDYAKIEAQVNLTGTEDYAVVAQKRHNKINFSIHVFSREATTKEIVTYEEMASRMRFRGNKAEIEGSQVLAAKDLYNKLIVRAYDVRVGRVLHDTLTAEQARDVVPPLVKRSAIREFLGSVMGASDLAESEGQEPESARGEDD